MPSQKVVFDLDDFAIDKENSFDILKRIKEHYPKFKVSLFTVIYPESVDRGAIPQAKLAMWGKAVNKYDWIEICPHGLQHLQGEGEASRSLKEAKGYVQFTEDVFKKFGVNHEKIWKSPYWQANELLYIALKEKDYAIALDRNNTPKVDLKSYVYNWSIDQELPKNVKVIKAHGHMDTTANALHLSYKNFMDKIDSDAEFMFISEYLKNEKT